MVVANIYKRLLDHPAGKYIWRAIRDCLCYWRTFVIILTPLVLLLIPCFWKSDPRSMSICAYVVVVMAVYWVTEAIPITVTALIPLFAFPLLGIQTAKTVAMSYLPDISFLFIGGLIVAVAVEEVNLHRRIALLVLLAMGSQPRWLMLGIMMATASLSMFISNTATTVMMTPIVLVLSKEIIATNRQTRPKNGQPVAAENSLELAANRTDPPAVICVEGAGPCASVESTGSSAADIELDPNSLDAEEIKLPKALLLATCYSGSIGGTATLTGTTPNLVMTQLLGDKYPNHPVNYATWFGYNGPGMIINIFQAWVWIQLAIFGPRRLLSCRGGSNPRVKAIIRGELRQMGALKWSEVSIIGLFLLLLFMWLARKPAWGRLFTYGTEGQFPSDGTSAMLVSFLLFLWPLERPDFLCCSGRSGDTSPKLRRSILTWEIVEKRLPWGIVFLLGGGFALGKGVASTGLSEVIGKMLTKLDVSEVQLCVISLLLMTYMTEFTSNTATSSILLPIIMTVAETRCMNPLYLTLPVTEAASFAYMLPVATPPNAIVFRAGVLRVRDMILVGVMMNTLCMCEVLLSINTWGYAMFRLGDWPDWAGNNTDCAP